MGNGRRAAAVFAGMAGHAKNSHNEADQMDKNFLHLVRLFV